MRIVDDEKGTDAGPLSPNGHPAMTVCENGAGEEPFSSRQNGDMKTVTDSEALPPSTLTADIAEEWRRVVADLRERRLWKDSMAGLVTAFVNAQATAQRLEIQIANEGAAVKGAGGALKPHPATGLLRSSRETVARLGGELGLSPTARSRKSLRPTEGQSDLFGNNGNPWDL